MQNWGFDPFDPMPNNPKVSYSRSGPSPISTNADLFEFVIPMFPDTALDPNVSSIYKELARSTATPTAVAISVLDVKEPADIAAGNTETKTHWCWAHYLIDGHHKLHAALSNGVPLRLLSFLSLNQGIASSDQLAELQQSTMRS